ncbi:MAG: hypothetical protein EFT35_09530 [Methanophagales archaeon ANME-1-THS]|nr:MAG: hypothetical protein EFT35_09530 [Methanophagales archaeon ANME-1-THS]
MGGDAEVMALHTGGYSSLPLALEYLENVKVCVMGTGRFMPLLNAYTFKELRVIEKKFEPEDITRRLKGVDVVLGGYGPGEQKEVAIAASELGVPFITYPLITTILPDGISFEEVGFPGSATSRGDTIAEILIRTVQVIELIKLFTGIGELVFPPEALELVIDPTTRDFDVRKIRVTVR